MVRVAVRLPEDDLCALRQLSRETGRSVAELVRRGVKHVLEMRGLSHQECLERSLSTAGIGHSGLPDVAERHDDYLAEAYED